MRLASVSGGVGAVAPGGCVGVLEAGGCVGVLAVGVGGDDAVMVGDSLASLCSGEALFMYMGPRPMRSQSADRSGKALRIFSKFSVVSPLPSRTTLPISPFDMPERTVSWLGVMPSSCIKILSRFEKFVMIENFF